MAEKPEKTNPAPATSDWLKNFWGETEYEEAPADVGLLPPRSASTRPVLRQQKVRDLSKFRKVWSFHGEGNSGKTLVARLFGGELLEHGLFDAAVMAALAPGNRNLTKFFTNVMQPDSSDPRATAAWTQRALSGIAKRQMNAVFDFGGGDAAMASLIEAVPSLAEAMEQQGIALIAAYLLTPRIEDLVYLRTYTEMGYKPSGTALILNLASAGNDPSVFTPMRNHPLYKAALNNGAVELWLPTLERRISLLIERNKLHFRQARDGIVPEGLQAPVLGIMDRLAVRDWMMQVFESFEPVKTWVPWPWREPAQ
jgi:hypothetical protein